MIGCRGATQMSLLTKTGHHCCHWWNVNYTPPPLAPSPPPPQPLPTRTTSMPAHYDISVVSVFVGMGGFDNQTATLLKQSHSWRPGDVSLWRRRRVVQRRDWKGRANGGRSWGKRKGTDTKKARLRWNKRSGAKSQTGQMIGKKIKGMGGKHEIGTN